MVGSRSSKLSLIFFLALQLLAPIKAIYLSTNDGKNLKTIPDTDEYLKALQQGPDNQANSKEKKAEEIEKKTDSEIESLGSFPDTAPYRPRNIPFEQFKHQCTWMLQSVVDHAGYDPERLHLFMPKCTWDNDNQESKTQKHDSSDVTDGSNGSVGSKEEKSSSCTMLFEDLKRRLTNMGDKSELIQSKEIIVAKPITKDTGPLPNSGNFYQHMQSNMFNAVEAESSISKLPAPLGSVQADITKENSADVSDATGSIFDWCNLVYNTMKERKLRHEIRKRIIEDENKQEQKNKDSNSDSESKDASKPVQFIRKSTRPGIVSAKPAMRFNVNYKSLSKQKHHSKNP